MYSETAADHFHNPRHVGVLEEAHANGQQGTPGHGPYMVLYLRILGDRIEQARFQTYGCPAAIACGSWVSDWVVGKQVGEAALLQIDQVTAGLGGLPLGKEHCPPLAVGALKSAIEKINTAGDPDTAVPTDAT